MLEAIAHAVDRRTLLRLALLAAVEKLPLRRLRARRPCAQSRPGDHRRGQKERDFRATGPDNIPRLRGELMPQALFYENCVNEGVTSHFNTISSILTGVWQHVDDWGRDLPRNPTLINYLLSQFHLDPTQAFVVTSNKALTANRDEPVP